MQDQEYLSQNLNWCPKCNKEVVTYVKRGSECCAGCYWPIEYVGFDSWQDRLDTAIQLTKVQTRHIMGW